MLVLSRKVQEQICLPGFDIVIKVLEISGGKVRLGIAAPRDVSIVRDELLTEPRWQPASGLTESTSAKPFKSAVVSPLLDPDLGSLLFPASAKTQPRKCV